MISYVMINPATPFWKVLWNKISSDHGKKILKHMPHAERSIRIPQLIHLIQGGGIFCFKEEDIITRKILPYYRPWYIILQCWIRLKRGSILSYNECLILLTYKGQVYNLIASHTLTRFRFTSFNSKKYFADAHPRENYPNLTSNKLERLTWNAGAATSGFSWGPLKLFGK